MRIEILWILSCLMVGLIYGCDHTAEMTLESQETDFCLDAAFKQKLVFEKPSVQPIKEGISLTGAIEPNPDKVVHFMSLVGGTITNTYFSLGDRVSKGQVLAKLKSTELSSLQAELAQLESSIEVAERRVRTLESMFDDGIAAHQHLLEGKNEVDILRSKHEKVRYNLNFYSVSPDNNTFQIKAPVGGIVTNKSIAVGTSISAESDPLFTISDLREVWALVNIYATDVQDIREGMDVNIKTLSYPDELFRGKIGAISHVYDTEARVLTARVILPNPDLKLKSGMLVDVLAVKVREKEVPAIPSDAVLFDDNQNFIVIHRSDCDMEIRPVSILTQSNGISYLSGGVNVNERFVSKNQLLIYEQLKYYKN